MTPAEEINKFLDEYEKGLIPIETLPTTKLIALCRELLQSIETVDTVCADPKVVGIFHLAAIRGQQYSGPKFNIDAILTRAAEIVRGSSLGRT